MSPIRASPHHARTKITLGGAQPQVRLTRLVGIARVTRSPSGEPASLQLAREPSEMRDAVARLRHQRLQRRRLDVAERLQHALLTARHGLRSARGSTRGPEGWRKALDCVSKAVHCGTPLGSTSRRLRARDAPDPCRRWPSDFHFPPP